MAAPNEVAPIAKVPMRTDERDTGALVHLYPTGILPEDHVLTMRVDRLRALVRPRAVLGFKMTRVKNPCHARVTPKPAGRGGLGSAGDWRTEGSTRGSPPLVA